MNAPRAPTWHAFPAREELASALAQAVAQCLRTAIRVRERALLALSGGTTPTLFLQQLSAQVLNWPGVIVTLVDERWVPADSPRSNERLLRESLLTGAAAQARLLPLYVDRLDPDDALSEVASRIGALPLPLDVVVLGMGADGHAASWFPGGDRLSEALDPQGTALVSTMRAEAAGEPRITLTLPPVVSARSLYLHIEGVEKRAVFERAARGDDSLPIAAVLREARAPVEVFWCP